MYGQNSLLRRRCGSNWIRTGGIDEIRLARSVVRGRRPIDDALLGAVADLAHDLGLQLGAGEVTSIDESHRLVDHGCHRQSGPLFGLPFAVRGKLGKYIKQSSGVGNRSNRSDLCDATAT